MKLFTGIFIICALITEASSLNCFSCWSKTRNCELKEEVCKSGSNDACVTVASSATLGRTLYFRGCGQCDESFSYNFGSVMENLECSSCSSDLCNNQTFPETPAANGLECFGCFDESSETCASRKSIVKCVGNQDRCIKTCSEQPFSHAPLNALKGCVSKNICKSAETTHLRIPITPNPSCCKGNLCNKSMRLSASGISLSLLAVVVVRTLL